MIDFNNYFKLNIVFHNNKTFQVLMNKTGNVIVVELIDNEYCAPQLSDLYAIKDEVYKIPQLYYLIDDEKTLLFKDIYKHNSSDNKFLVDFKNKFITIAVIAGIITSVFIVRCVDNQYHIFDNNGNNLESNQTSFSISNELNSLEEVRAVYKEVITKDDLVIIVNDKAWNPVDKELMLEFIELLPADQDLFMLRENLLKMSIESYSRDEWNEKINLNTAGDFDVSTGKIRYVIDDFNQINTKRRFRHEALHATTSVQTKINNQYVNIGASLHNYYLNEIGVVLYEASLETDAKNILNNVDSYESILPNFNGYIKYYGPELIIDFLKNGDIEGFIDFASNDFPDIREHISLTFVVYSDITKATDENFDRLIILTFETFFKAQNLMLEEDRYIESDYKKDSSMFMNKYYYNRFYEYLSQAAKMKGIDFNSDKYLLIYENMMIEFDTVINSTIQSRT